LQTLVLWCWFVTVSIVQIVSYEFLSKKGGNCLMIAKYMSLLNQVVMTVGLPVSWNP